MTDEIGELPTLEAMKFQNRGNYPNFYLKNMKPVNLDVGLDFHEKLVHKVDQSLKSTKNRLQKTELLLNLEPPSDEVSHHDEWEETIKDLLSSNHRLEFPKFSRLQKQHELKQLMQRQTKSREKARSREDYNRRAAMILAKETQNLQKKILAGKGQFGGAVKGVEIKTIQNYQGCNTFDRGTRTLIRKDGQKLPESHETSLPPWFGPQYYEVNYDPLEKKDSSYQVAFKSPERSATSSEVINRENMRRRRFELAEVEGNNTGRDNIVRPEQINSALRQSPNPGKLSSFIDVDDTSNLSDGMGGNNDEEDSISSYPSISASKDGADEVSIASSKDFSDESLGRILERYDANMMKSQRRQTPMKLNPTHNRLSTTPLPDNRMIAREKKRRKKLKRQPTRRDSATSTVLNPIVTHHSYALKILESDDPSKQRGWKPKDYTLSALVNQRPIEFSTYFLEDSFVDGKDSHNALATDSALLGSKPSTATASTLLPTHSTTSASTATRTTIKYSSEIFRRHPGSIYKSTDQLLKEVESSIEKRKKNLNQTTSPPPSRQHGAGVGSIGGHSNQMSASTVILPAQDILETGSLGSGKSSQPSLLHEHAPSFLDTNSLATSVGESQASTNSPLPQLSQTHVNQNMSPRDINPSRSLTPVKDIFLDEVISMEVMNNNQLNASTSLPFLKMSSKRLLRSSFSSTILKPSPSKDRHSSTSSSTTPYSFGEMLKTWYKENHIIKYKATAGPTLKQKYLQSQVASPEVSHYQQHEQIPRYMQDPRRSSMISPRKRPSLELSLRGLLLEENPYLTKEQQDRLITENQHKDLHEIQV